jgi:hypothetical protein
MTQRELVIKYIEDFGSISPMEAFHDLGITKLATVVSLLKRDGYKFNTVMEKSVNRYGKKTHYCRYSMR